MTQYIEREEDDRACGWCGHASDCAIHNEPALENGECDCGYIGGKGLPVDALVYSESVGV